MIGTETTSVLVNGSPTMSLLWVEGCVKGALYHIFLFLLVIEGVNVMLQSYVKVGLYTCYLVRSNSKLCISHLHFANATLIVWEKSRGNVRTLKANLILFEFIWVCLLVED